MSLKWREEEKASLDGIEIPIQCMQMKQTGKRKSPIPHYHDYVEILYGLTGNLEVWINGKTRMLSQNTMIVIHSRAAHMVLSHDGKAGTYIVIKYMPQVLYAEQQTIFELKYIAPFMTDSDIYSNYFDAKSLNHTEIPDVMQNIYKEWETKAYGYEIALRIYVLKISLWLVRQWHDKLNAKLPEMHMNKNLLPAIAKAMEFAQKNYSTATTLLAAQTVGMSYSYFSRIFKKVMNKSFSEYLNRIRIAEAKRMLICTDADITRIAMDVGFSTSSYFIEQFKKQNGITPKKFRTLSYLGQQET